MIVFCVGVKTNLRNPVTVGQSVGINFHVVPVKWQPFAVPTNAHSGWIQLLDSLLVRGTETRQMRSWPGSHAATRIESEAVAPQKLVIFPSVVIAGDVQAIGARSIVVGRGLAGKLRKKSLNVIEGHMFHEISPECAA